MAETVDVEAFPVLYLTLRAAQRFLMAHTELAWPLLALLVGLWFLGVFGRLYGAIIDFLYYRREAQDPSDLDRRRRALLLAREDQQRTVQELSAKDAEERKEKERQETIEKAKLQSKLRDTKDYRPINFNNDDAAGRGRYRFGQDRYKGRT